MQTFPELFQEIGWSFEVHEELKVYVDQQGIEHVHFNKLSLSSNGIAHYKTNRWTFSPHLWPKVVKLVELLQVTEAERALFIR